MSTPFAQRHDLHEMILAYGIYAGLTTFRGTPKDIALAQALGLGGAAYLFMIRHGHDPSKLFSTVEGIALLTSLGFFAAELK